eukprot:sb/3477618/
MGKLHLVDLASIGLTLLSFLGAHENCHGQSIGLTDVQGVRCPTIYHLVLHIYRVQNGRPRQAQLERGADLSRTTKLTCQACRGSFESGGANIFWSRDMTQTDFSIEN